MKRNPYNKKSQSQVINEFIAVHGDRYDYSLVVYNTAHEKIKIICKTHGVFEQSSNKHRMTRGCPSCKYIEHGNKTRKSLGVFIDQARQVHGNIYDYSNVIYRNTDKNIKIGCKKHGIFEQTPYSHIRKKSGCPKCSIKKRSMGQMKTTETFIKEASIIHNNLYDYSLAEYIGAHRKIKILCIKHGIFEQSPRNHLNGNGCPTCKLSHIISDVSQEWLDFIDVTEREMRIPENRRLSADGFDKKSNTVYLFHGDYWHGNPKIYNPNDINPQNKKSYGELYEKTIRIENEIKSYGYNMVTIWENDWREYKKSLQS